MAVSHELTWAPLSLPPFNGMETLSEQATLVNAS